MALVWPVPFEVLHALTELILRLAELVLLLLEVVVGTAEDSGHTLKLVVEIFSILPVSDLDMHEEAIGHKMELVAKPFDEHAIMADPLIHVVEPTVMTV